MKVLRVMKLSLTDGDGTLPHWMVFRKQSNCLAGLVLTEDCGIYRLKVSVTGERCTARFYLHMLNRTETDRNPVCVYPSLPLTRASLSVTSTLTHEAADRDSLATRLTQRPPQRETPFWSQSWTADRTESESQSSLSSQGLIVHKEEPIKDPSVAKSAPPHLPSDL